MIQYAESQTIGVGVDIHPTAEFLNVKRLVIGDHSYIGPGVRIIGGEFVLGDYSKIHNNTYIYSKNHVRLGHCAWIGQGVHLDGTGGISAGDFLGVGINSALYSHIRHGDLLEGNRFSKDSYLTIGDDVWFVGMCMIGPVTAGNKSMALLGSVVTKDLDDNHVYGGNPAKDLTEKMGTPWIEKTIDEKASELDALIGEFCTNSSTLIERDQFVVCDNFPEILDERTYYNVRTRSYTKTNSKQEVELNKWLFGYRAKFRPEY